MTLYTMLNLIIHCYEIKLWLMVAFPMGGFTKQQRSRERIGVYGDKTSKLAMSDRLKDLELELCDVIVALKDVAGTQWYDLGLQL